MSPCCELPDLRSSVRQARAERPERPGRQIGRLPGIRALRLADGPASAARWTLGGLSRWRRRRTAIRELQALSDHYLADIGLDRSQIVSTVERIVETGDQPA